MKQVDGLTLLPGVQVPTSEGYCQSCHSLTYMLTGLSDNKDLMGMETECNF